MSYLYRPSQSSHANLPLISAMICTRPLLGNFPAGALSCTAGYDRDDRDDREKSQDGDVTTLMKFSNMVGYIYIYMYIYIYT